MRESFFHIPCNLLCLAHQQHNGQLSRWHHHWQDRGITSSESSMVPTSRSICFATMATRLGAACPGTCITEGHAYSARWSQRRFMLFTNQVGPTHHAYCQGSCVPLANDTAWTQDMLSSVHATVGLLVCCPCMSSYCASNINMNVQLPIGVCLTRLGISLLREGCQATPERRSASQADVNATFSFRRRCDGAP